MVTANPAHFRTVRTAALLIMLFSAVAVLLALFVFPVACSFLGGLQLVSLGLLFLAGLLALVVEHFLWRRKHGLGKKAEVVPGLAPLNP